MTIGFIGFGGAAYGLTKGLKESGLQQVCFFDSLCEIPAKSEVIFKHGAETGAVFKKSIEQLVRDSEIIISSVTGSVALPVAEQAARFMEPHHLYVDVNTASPKTMEAAADVVEARGASFADVAMLGAVPAFLHRVPCLASGSGAERFKAAMEPYEMDITCVGKTAGQASAIKMFRSVFMKGFLALLMEMLSGTHRYKVDALVLESIARTMEKNPFLETVRLQMAKGVLNAERMSHEMEAVVETYAEMELPSVMASATCEKLKWCSAMNFKDYFAGSMSESLAEILDVMDEKIRG